MATPTLSDAKRRLGSTIIAANRWRLGRSYLRGTGIEIGALHAPYRVPAQATVAYVDRLPVSELRHHYPELEAHSFVAVDLIDDAETLETIPSSSQDFVIASHVLEHCQDPIGALRAWLRVVVPGGAVLLAVPDKRYTFDSVRPVTPLAHVVQDHLSGPTWSRDFHYQEWVRLVEHAPHEQITARAKELCSSDYKIHFHVWDFDALHELLSLCAARFTAARLAKLCRNRSENLAVLTRATSDRL